MSDDNMAWPTDPDMQDALRAKADAEARKVDADARKAKAEADAAESPSARLALESQNLLSVAESEQKAAAARQQQLSAFIPDLSKVKEGKLEVAEGPGIGSSGLTFGGVADAAIEIVQLIDQPTAETWQVLVTSDQDIATPDGQFVEVDGALSELIAMASSVLKDTELPKESEESEITRVEPGGFRLAIIPALPGLVSGALSHAPAAIGALASALPQVLSLLSTQRSVTSGTVTVTDLAAAAAVAGALEKREQNQVEVVFDDFRLITKGRIHVKAARLAKKRIALVARKLALADSKNSLDVDLTAAKQTMVDAEKALDEADPKKAPHHDLEAKLKTARQNVQTGTRRYYEATERLTVVESMISTIDAFTAAIRAVPTGARRSPFATAALYEQLHPAEKPSVQKEPSDEGNGQERLDPEDAAEAAAVEEAERGLRRFTHVLLVKAQPGQWTQLVSDRAIGTDKFSTVVEVNVTFILISTQDSRVVRSGTVTSLVTTGGTLGDKIEFHHTTRQSLHQESSAK